VRARQGFLPSSPSSTAALSAADTVPTMMRRWDSAGTVASRAAIQARMCSGLKEPRGREPM
jgi:hypothetical protein